jgi:NDP-sugar pyrophosphorylase family protein
MPGGRYQGVILAAGHGSRMGPFGDAVPKPIAPVCNKPLLGYQLEHLRGLGIDDVIVVIGHLGRRIVDTLGDGAAWGVRIRYVEQERRLGLAHAVGQLEPHISAPFVLMLGDIFFEVDDLAQMTRIQRETHAAAVLAVKDEPNPAAIRRNFAVLADEKGAVRRVIEKPRVVPNRLKGCGIYLFDERIFEAVRRTPRTAMRDEYELTDSIQILIDYEYPVRTAAVVTWDMNVTFIGDLIECCVHVLRNDGMRSLVGRNCNIAEGAELIDSVVGDNATVIHPVRFDRCVVMPGATVASTVDLADAVITADAVLHGSVGPA